MAEIKCPSCGSPNVEQIDTDKYQCPYCGNTFSGSQSMAAQSIHQLGADSNQGSSLNNKDIPNTLMNVLSFIFPIVGIVLYFVKKNTEPNCAKTYLQWALLSIVIYVLIEIIAAL